ncbi:hypothetical protein P7C70_g7401, partial [Phenoliferia sp. Uapishka_3]
MMFSKEPETLAKMMSILLHLPAIHALAFPFDAAQHLFGTFVEGTPSTLEGEATIAYHLRILRRIGPTIRFLSLDHFTIAAAASLVSCFPNLRTLSLAEVTPKAEDDLQKILDALASLQSLTHLSVEAETTFHIYPSPTSFDKLRANPPPLKCLQIFLGQLDQPLLDLISIFSPTLLMLDLRVQEGENPADLPPGTRLHLPLLSSLILCEYGDSTPDLFTLFDNNGLVRFSYRGNTDDELDQSHVVNFIARQTILHELHLGYSPPLNFWGSSSLVPKLPTPSAQLNYSKLVHSRDLDPSVLDDTHSSPYHPDANLGYDDDAMDCLTDALAQTLDFGRIEVKRMVAERNVAKALWWIDVLRRLEEERLDWKV